MFSFSRRSFLRIAPLMTLATSQFIKSTLANQSTSNQGASTSPSDQSSSPCKYAIFCYFEGGWDSLLALDPRDAMVFDDQHLNETLIQPAYHLLPPQFPRNQVNAGSFFLGPCATPLLPYANDLTLIKGIDMGTLTHDVGKRYLITGQAPLGLSARGSSLSSIITYHLGDQGLVPNLAHHVESYNDQLPAFTTALSIGGVDQLKYLLKDQLGVPNQLPLEVKGALEDLKIRQLRYAQAYHQTHSNDLNAKDRDWLTNETLKYLESRTKVRHLINSHLADSFDFSSASQMALRNQYQLNTQALESPYGRAALASQALKKGLSKVVSVSLSEGLDTHDQSWATQHSIKLWEGFDALGKLIEDLKNTEAPEGGSLLDHTAIIAFSEFSRTPLLNIRSGRDHHFNNQLLIIAPGIQKGVWGQSSDLGMAPQLFDETGKASPNGKALRPGDIAKTILKIMGVDQVLIDQNIRVGEALKI